MGLDPGGGGASGGLAPFDRHPADPGAIEGAAGRLEGLAAETLDRQAVTERAFEPATASWHGVAAAELRTAPEPVRAAGLQAASRLRWGGVPLRHWAEQVRSFNSVVDGIVAALGASAAGGYGATGENGAPPSPEAVDAARQEVEAAARREWMVAYERHIVDGRTEAAAMLRAGPPDDDGGGSWWCDLISDLFGDQSSCGTDEVRLLNLNVGMGHGNLPSDPDGTDIGQMDDIADIIVEQEADVVTLQEVFSQLDIEVEVDGERNVLELERMLEERTGQEWDLHYARTEDKFQYDDALWGFPGDTALRPFGNAVLVRRGSGVVSSQPVENTDLDGEEEQRVLQRVQVVTEDGGRLDVYNTHIASMEEGDPEQVDQIRQVWDEVGANPYAVVAGDFNQTLDAAEAGADELLRFEDLGFAHAGAVDGGTQDDGEGALIDYIFTGEELGYGEAEIVDGGPSDHHGLVVDISVPDP